MSWVIKYYYKDCLVSVMGITIEMKRMGWANNNPPFQPENWDKWEVGHGLCEEC